MSQDQIELYKNQPLELLKLSRQGTSLPPELAMQATLQLKEEISNLNLVTSEKIAAFYALSEIAAKGYMVNQQATEAIAMRAIAAAHVHISPSSPLYHLDQFVAENTAKQRMPEFGAHISHLGDGSLKNGQVKIQRRVIDGQEQHQLKFRLTEPARVQLQQNLLLIQDNFSTFMEYLPPQLKGVVAVSEVDDVFEGKSAKSPNQFTSEEGYQPGEGDQRLSAKAIKVEFPGVGAILIGNSPNYWEMYHDVRVLVDPNLPPGEAASRAQSMLMALGMGPILQPQSPEDLEKIKLAHIFRTYEPKGANAMERSQQFYSLSTDELRSLIIEKYPHMQPIFERYEANPHLCQEVETYAGKKSWALMDISDQMREKGAYGFMRGVRNAEAVVSALKYGSLSTQDRFEAGSIVKGTSPEQDFRSASGDRVFARLFNSSNIKNKISEIDFAGAWQILFKLETANVGTVYGYREDRYGEKNPVNSNYAWYMQRDSIVDFAGDNFAKDSRGRITQMASDNEVMFRNYIPPSYICGINCTSKETRNHLIGMMTREGLIEVRDNKQYLTGTDYLIDEFVHLSDKSASQDYLKKEMWN